MVNPCVYDHAKYKHKITYVSFGPKINVNQGIVGWVFASARMIICNKLTSVLHYLTNVKMFVHKIYM